MNTAARQVEVLAKQRPRQARAKRTYDAILASAAELLVEVGIERISTNLIAERAGVTVPALYRYFPNKYAVIHALATGLMERQGMAFQGWLGEQLAKEQADDVIDAIATGFGAIYDITLAEPAGLEIFHALRALGPLRELRHASRRRSAAALAGYLAALVQQPVDDELLLKCRITVDLTCNIIESAIDDNTLDESQVLREGAALVAAYWRPFMERVNQAGAA